MLKTALREDPELPESIRFFAKNVGGELRVGVFPCRDTFVSWVIGLFDHDDGPKKVLSQAFVLKAVTRMAKRSQAVVNLERRIGHSIDLRARIVLNGSGADLEGLCIDFYVV